MVTAAQGSDQPESDTLERKSALDIRQRKDFLGLVNDIAAFANTRGGVIEIGLDDFSKDVLAPHFDSARIDDKVNSLVQPRVTGLSSTISAEGLVRITVPKSSNPPHMFSGEGNYQDDDGKQKSIFRRGDIVVRHGSKTERAERADFDRWFEEQRSKLLENVKMIFEAGPEARIRVDSKMGEPVKIVDPSTAGARPVYGVITSDPFTDFNEELTGGVKAWKSSVQTLNEAQIFKAYRERASIDDMEHIGILLVSCWQNRLPGYCWATKCTPLQLRSALAKCISEDRYPASSEALKVASLLPREVANQLVNSGRAAKREGTRKLATKLRERVLKGPRGVVWHKLARVVISGQRFPYYLPGGRVDVDFNDVDEKVFEEILSTLPARLHDNRAPFRYAELICFGDAFSEFKAEQFESLDGAA